MCRWLAYSGSPVLLEDLLYKPENSLVVQSKHSQMGATTTNGDGFGVGWYGAYETPGLFRSTEPAWNDLNLRELCAHAKAGRVFAHIRASTGSAVQQTNCHPFRYENWLWMHNGYLAGFHEMKRDLAMEVDPDLFADIQGSTDSEMLFFLALSFGLRDDPRAGVARAVGLVEEVGRSPRHRVPGADDGGDHRRRHDLGLPVLQRGQVALAVPEHRRVDAAPRSTPTTRCCTGCRTTPGSWCPSPWASLQGAWREIPESSSVHGARRRRRGGAVRAGRAGAPPDGRRPVGGIACCGQRLDAAGAGSA